MIAQREMLNKGEAIKKKNHIACERERNNNTLRDIGTHLNKEQQTIIRQIFPLSVCLQFQNDA